MTKKAHSERASNIELLRIIAMAMVLMVHTDFASLGFPTPKDMANAPAINTFVRYAVESVSIICVNLFVFISGYFGIKAKPLGVLNILFQWLFFATIVFTAYAIGKGHFSWKYYDITALWFVPAYIGLYVISPILNAFIEKCSKNKLRNYIILFAIIQTCWGWYTDSLQFNRGYSVMSFAFLYLLARYIKLHGKFFMSYNKWYDAMMYMQCNILILATVYASYYWGMENWKDIVMHTYAYNSPIVIAETVTFFLFFSKLEFKSKIVNWIAASAFSVYLLHFMLIEDIVHSCKHIYTHNSLLYYTFEMFVLIITAFISAVLLDKIRLSVWKKLLSYIQSKKV